ncbi:MAG: hypothetical protein NTX50_18775, partial [Candidatus Sumerlaeota bacterium]|nr:hypothetical protein [Candidatus Sumerlaeota bacterium]
MARESQITCRACARTQGRCFRRWRSFAAGAPLRISLAALTMAALAVAAPSPYALAQGTEATIVVIVRLAPSAPAAPTIIPEPFYTFGTQNEVSWIASPSRSVTTYTIQCDNTPAFGGPAAQADVSSPALSQTFINLSL